MRDYKINSRGSLGYIYISFILINDGCQNSLSNDLFTDKWEAARQNSILKQVSESIDIPEQRTAGTLPSNFGKDNPNLHFIHFKVPCRCLRGSVLG